ncbi:MSHA pilin protein MshC [Vibrio rotiferianus]|uniref:type II secretion system protein n=1 Tax=Vibrio rotiferianus TaxID=190895 RepID=UPI00289490AA|nr:MSHA pilin protein MshC [Vibrio rotiferianus]
MQMRTSSSGFTLIELIMVIVILTIVSLYAASRYMSSGISVFAAQEESLAIIRQVQVNRMQSNVSGATSNNNFILSISNDCLGSVSSCNSRSDSRSDWSSPDNIRYSPNRTISFDLLGNPSGGAKTITITESTGQTCIVTINTQGYVSKGACS